MAITLLLSGNLLRNTANQLVVAEAALRSYYSGDSSMLEYPTLLISMDQ